MGWRVGQHGQAAQGSEEDRAVRTVQIDITAEHISSGRAKDCERCPIALALKVAFPEASEIHVWGASASVVFSDDIHCLLLPESALQFIREFDRTGSSQPFAFTAEMRLPGGSQ
jgi:hypothetical protein